MKSRDFIVKKSIDKMFYYRLLVYILVMIVSLYLLGYAITTFSMVAGIDLVNLPSDICEQSSSNYDQFLCFINTYKDGSLYYVFYSLSLISIILSSMVIVIINVIYIVNRFYLKIIRKEKSCGVVLYKVQRDDIYYLLLFYIKGHVGFCKGHQEKDETDEQTALRHVKELTGYNVELDDEFKEKINYNMRTGNTKDVYYFIGESNEEKIAVEASFPFDVAGYKWCKLEECLDLLNFDNDRYILIKADRRIKEKHKLKIKISDTKYY